jgi:sec-independent protein translocase protein TatC
MAHADRLKKLAASRPQYPDDMFAETRMPLGDHIEELRYRMFAALKWLAFFMIIGFVLDAVGTSLGNEKIGVGKPMLKIITEPVETQARDFYYRRALKVQKEKIEKIERSDSEAVAALRAKMKDDPSLASLSSEERKLLLGAPSEMRVFAKTKQLEPLVGPLKPGTPDEIPLTFAVYPAEISVLSDTGVALADSKQYLTTLSAQEAFVVYFKVSILCGIILASPFIFYQFWAFVGAGLYPHEKKYVYIFFVPSLVLFLCGVLLCQFWVLPGAVKALLKFNEILGFDPDIRLHEWLGLAIILPLVFGISFQTPLVMIFLNRIGLFSAGDYLTKWRYACFILAVFAAVITPTPDVVTMMYLFVPMFALYMVGILFCHLFPGFDPNALEEPVPADEIAV